ncbi:uracil-DNA glycosylase family protein [Fulvivirga sp. M361]|uniref:uracil-DNA glycosylase family protein n=1 Tax=Fulvivirga sp. M361 TaxID=2594266 RepID=UPI00117A93A4|nr:uracil-DNA glycosylase family protein [Fulvivirga sp. M361]TRX59108.1 uracil-DNA glycosylase family protein [Fulvivirga sp. M361]
MESLLREISKCTVCAPQLELGVNPVVTADPESKVVIIGQAPGRIVHETSIPWNDKSGDNLRSWLKVDKTTFYDTKKIAIIPMGFCYPGKGKSGDLPPRPECAPLWHTRLLAKMKKVQLTLLIGQYAQTCYLNSSTKKTLTETVKNYKTYLPSYFVLPHPSPRNNIWRARNPWFDQTVIPELQERIRTLIAD